MKKLLFLLAAIALTGCSSLRQGQATLQSNAPATGTPPAYAYELEYVSADGYTPFLHWVEVDP